MENTANFKKITVRTAPSFGYQLANEIGLKLEKDNIAPSHWPVKFPLTLKEVNKMPEIAKNIKVARKVIEAAKIIWQDMRQEAIEIEKDIKLHPEFYELITTEYETDHVSNFAWRHLSMEIEQLAGNVYVTEFNNEEFAKKHVYSNIHVAKLKEYMKEFEDDYQNFMHEIRETIRSYKHLSAAERFDLICLLNHNTKTAIKSLKRASKKSTIQLLNK